MFIRNRVENPFLFLSKMQPRAIKSVFYVNSDLKQNYDRNEIVFLKVSLETQQKLNPVYINRALTKNAVVLLVSRPSTLMFFGCGWLVGCSHIPTLLFVARFMIQHDAKNGDHCHSYRFLKCSCILTMPTDH